MKLVKLDKKLPSLQTIQLVTVGSLRLAFNKIKKNIVPFVF